MHGRGIASLFTKPNSSTSSLAQDSQKAGGTKESNKPVVSLSSKGKSAKSTGPTKTGSCQTSKTKSGKHQESTVDMMTTTGSTTYKSTQAISSNKTNNEDHKIGQDNNMYQVAPKYLKLKPNLNEKWMKNLRSKFQKVFGDDKP